MRFSGQGRGRQASTQADAAFSAAAVDIQGLHSEAYSQLYWEADAQVRQRALTPPAALRPSPARQALPPVPAPPPQLTTPLPLPKPPKQVLDPTQKPYYAPAIAKWHKKGGSIQVLDNGNWQYTD